MSEATSRQATQFEMRFDSFYEAANCGRSTSRLSWSPPALLGLPNGRWGEITFAATPSFEGASRLPEEQPARKARMVTAASVATNNDMERPDLLYTTEGTPYFLSVGERE